MITDKGIVNCNHGLLFFLPLIYSYIKECWHSGRKIILKGLLHWDMIKKKKKKQTKMLGACINKPLSFYLT